MANTKDIYIKGWLAFDAGQDDKLLMKLGQMVMPSMGLKIKFTGEAKYVPSVFGGVVHLSEFIIRGVEAVSDAYLRDLVGRIDKKATGEIVAARYRDLDYDPKDKDWYRITPEIFEG